MSSALLLIDLQRDYLEGSRLSPHRAALIDSAASMLDSFRRRDVPIFHVVTTVTDNEGSLPHWKSQARPRCVAGTRGHAPPDQLTPAGDERVFHKRWYSGCEDPGLVSALRAAQVETVYLCGVHLRACLRATAIDLSREGFEVVLVDEACGDDDPVHGMIVRDWLVTRFCRAESVGDVLRKIEKSHPGVDITPAADAHPTAKNLAPAGPLSMWHQAPATGEPLYAVELHRQSEIQQATALCRTAGSGWIQTTISQRIKLLLKVADAVERQSETFARLITRETGKPIVDSRLEVAFGVALVRDVCLRAEDLVTGEAGPGWRMVRRPHGTAA